MPMKTKRPNKALRGLIRLSDGRTMTIVDEVKITFRQVSVLFHDRVEGTAVVDGVAYVGIFESEEQGIQSFAKEFRRCKSCNLFRYGECKCNQEQAVSSKAVLVLSK